MLALRRRSQLLARNITAPRPQYASIFRQRAPLPIIRTIGPAFSISHRTYARFSSGRGSNNAEKKPDGKDPKRPSLEEFKEKFQAEYDFPVDTQNFADLPLPAQTFIRLMTTPKVSVATLNPLFDIGAKFWAELKNEEKEEFLTLMRRNEMEELVLTLYNAVDGDFSEVATTTLAEATFKTFQTFRAQSNESLDQLIANNSRLEKVLKEIQDQATIPGFKFFNFGGGKGGSGIQFGFNTGSGKGGQKEIRFDAGTVFVSLFLTYILWKATMPGEPAQEITWQEFRSAFLDKGLVEKLTVINRDVVRVTLNRAATQQQYAGREGGGSVGYNYYFSIGSVDAFERKLEDAQDDLDIPPSERIPVSYTSEVSWLSTMASVLPTLLLIGSIFWLSRKAGTPGGGIGKSRAKLFNAETDIKTKFKDVAGMDEAKQEIMEFVSFLKTPGIYQKLGAKIPRGAILAGPPGTGKTLLAKATAGEAGVPFFSVSGSEFVEMFVGVGPSRVRDLFAKARKNTPCIIFIDEIDAIGRSRAKGNFGGGNDERESTLNQLLTEMDGFNTTDQIVVLAGTNRADVLDKALMRPGRFDRHIYVDRPTMSGRKQIFIVHLKNIVTHVDMDYLSGRLAALTPGFAGADIANCVNEAAVIAARNKAESVELTHFEQAIERVIAGLEKKSMVLAPEEKKIVAYHEAGHAICGWYLKYADPLLKVSIIPRGQGALGYAQYLPEGDRYLMSVNQFKDRMIMTLGGRVSEELHFETVTSGGSDDFNKVTQMANSMVTRYGMSKELGTITYVVEDNALNKPFSEETARKIDEEIKKIVDAAYEGCRKLLTEKKKEVGLVAEELLKKEVIGREDMIRLLGRRPWGDNKEFEKFFDARDGKTITPPPFPQETENTDSDPKSTST